MLADKNPMGHISHDNHDFKYDICLERAGLLALICEF